MKKFHKLRRKLSHGISRSLSLLLMTVTMLGIMAPAAGAASTTAYDVLSSSKYAKVYTLSSSGRTIPYTNQNLNVRGTASYGASSSSYIDNRTDELYLMDVGCTNGQWWAYVQYPSGSRRVNAYIHLSTITGNNGSHAKATSTGKFYCSVRETSGTSSSYYVAAGDTVYLLNTGSKYQIMYPSGSKWRIAFCSPSDYNKYVGGGNNNNNNNNNNGNNGQIVINGTYTIATAMNQSLVLDVENNSHSNMANIQIYTYSDGNKAQIFQIKHIKDGWHQIIHKDSGKAIDVAGGVSSPMVNVWLYDSSNTSNAAQLWKFVKASNGGYYLQNKLGTWLDVQWGNASKNANVWTYSYNGNSSETWHLRTVSSNNDNKGTLINVLNTDTWQYPFLNGKATLTNAKMGWSTFNDARKDRQYHLAVDIYGNNGNGDNTTVVAAAKGKVVECSNSNSGANGRYVVIEHTLNGKKVYSFYAHLASINVYNGMEVNKGERIGVVGGSGDGRDNRYGVHLHFAIADTRKPGSYYGYGTKFSGNKVTYSGVTFYNPDYVVANDRLPG